MQCHSIYDMQTCEEQETSWRREEIEIDKKNQWVSVIVKWTMKLN